MSEPDVPPQESRTSDREDEEETHPLDAGIEAAVNGDTVSLEDLFLDSSDP